jgi:DNA repair exonuclease SbcCD ATPase subunit
MIVHKRKEASHMSLECEHGQLARSCNICEYEREIAELRARVAELEAERDGYRNGQQQLQNTLSTVMDSNAKWANDYKELKAENQRLREALERIAAYDSYHSEWPTEIWINAPPEELAHVILSGGKYPPQQTHVGGKL